VEGRCGVCTVVLEGKAVKSCLMLAVQADGATVETIEGATQAGRLKKLQDAFYERAALQCGFCTSGMLLTAAEFLTRNSKPTREEIRAAISGNYCRCTGYQAIVDAIEAAAKG
jgi:carbon-monoxide dehydrogenase small subunit